MKKLIVAAVAIASAVIANAATVNWTVTGITAPGTTTKTSGYAGYVFDEATVASSVIAAAIADGTFDTQASKALSTGTSNASGVITKTGLGSYGASATTADPEVRNFYTVLFDAGSYSDAENYILTSDVTVTFTSASGAKPAAFTNITTSSSWTAMGVPEPTSGLLVLLGVAGLALRRRRA